MPGFSDSVYTRIMFLRTRLLSARHGEAGILLAAVTFALGLGVGATVAPVTAGHNEAAPPVASPIVQPAETGAVRMAHPAEVVRVLDGDTFEARVHLWPGLEITTRVRLRGIDAPEMKARCGEERARAEAARDTLRSILDQGEVGISNVALDKYGGRILADASTQATPNVSTALLGAGAVRRYSGGQRDGWCG